MEKIRILTSQNVAIKYTLARAGERVISNIIDLLIKIGYAILIGLVLYLIDIDNTVARILVIGLPLLLYTPLMEIFMNGQTLGMRVRQTKVISLDGRELTVGSILLRSVLRLVDISFSSGSVGLISMTASDKGQRLGDIAAGTTVVKIEPQASFEEIHFTVANQDYKLIFEQVKNLDDPSMAVIREALSTFERTQNRSVLEAAATKVKELLSIESTFSSHKFLETVVSDYNYLNGSI